MLHRNMLPFNNTVRKEITFFKPVYSKFIIVRSKYIISNSFSQGRRTANIYIGPSCSGAQVFDSYICISINSDKIKMIRNECINLPYCKPWLFNRITIPGLVPTAENIDIKRNSEDKKIVSIF